MKTLRNKKIIVTLSLGALLIIGASGFKLAQSGDWVAPASADKVINPVKGIADATKSGKKLFSKYCVVCHGNKGKGDGIAGASLKPKPANFTTDKFQKQTDGAIYWKLTEGRSPMASYEKILTEEQRWQLVNFMRTLKPVKK